MTLMLSQLIPGAPDVAFGNVCYHSGKVKPGDIFVAIEGFRVDGHEYALEAQKRGAACLVCQRPIDGLAIPFVVVEDSRKALAHLAREKNGRPDEKLKLIGVTGTNGKTSVTYLLKHVLEQCGHKVGLIGTNQNMIGSQVLPAERTTPEAPELMELLRDMVEQGCTHAIMEVSSHSLVLHRVYGCRFEAAAFTNLTQDHLDFHGTMGNYLDAKAKLFDMCKTAVINTDDAAGQVLAQAVKCPTVTYGIERADVTATNVQTTAGGVSFTCCNTSFSLAVPGMFSVYNALATIALSMVLGAELPTISQALLTASGVKGRAELVPTGRDFTVMIDYAHTPDGLKNILESVRGFAKGRVMLLFGCGGDRDKGKRAKMGKIAGELADLCIVTSDNPRSEDPVDIIRDILSGMNDAIADYIVLENRRDAIYYAIRQAQPGDVVILAGKGHETYQVLKDGTIDFDERKVVEEALRQLD